MGGFAVVRDELVSVAGPLALVVNHLKLEVVPLALILVGDSW